MSTSGRRERHIVYVIPTGVILAVLTIVPIAFTVWLSLRSWVLTTPGSNRFVGFDTYLTLLRSARFRDSLESTVYLSVLPITFQMILGCSLALLLFYAGPRSRTLRILFMLPSLIPPVVVGLLWRVLLAPSISVVNYGFEQVGVSPLDWFGTSAAARAAITIAATWAWAPFVMLLVLAGLESIPNELFEAARVDGAQGLQVITHIMFPLVLPVIYVALLFRIVDALSVLPLIFIMTGGGPAGSTEVVNYLAYSKFTRFELSEAAAICLLIFVTLSAFGLYVASVLQRQERAIA